MAENAFLHPWEWEHKRQSTSLSQIGRFNYLMDFLSRLLRTSSLRWVEDSERAVKDLVEAGIYNGDLEFYANKVGEEILS